MINNKFSVFTKPWKHLSLDELGRFIKSLGFDGIEFPLREGFQVEPADAEKGLPLLVKKMGEYNIEVNSIAGATTEEVFAGCSAAGIPLIRIMLDADLEKGYMASEYEMKKRIESFLPLCEKYGVKVGIQNHFGPMVSNSMEMRHLLEGFDPKYVGAIWDAAHSALAGEEPEQGLDIVWQYLCLVNIKSAYYKLKSGLEAEESEFEIYFTTGRHGLSRWRRIADYLRKRQYDGVFCLSAEYSDKKNTDRYIAEDIAYCKSLFTVK